MKLDKIEFPEDALKEYKKIKTYPIGRRRLLCRMHTRENPKKGYTTRGPCFAEILDISEGKRKGVSHITYNPHETLRSEYEDKILAWDYNDTPKELLIPQKINKPRLKKEETYMWLHLGKIYGLLPKDSDINRLIEEGIELSMSCSPTLMLTSLMHMRHMWREKGFVKSVLYLLAKTNMDFWQAYVLASNGKTNTSGEHTFYRNHFFRTGRGDIRWVNICLLPALRMVFENPSSYDKRSAAETHSWSTDQSFLKAGGHQIWLESDILYKLDLRPFIYSNILKEGRPRKDKTIKFLKEMVGDNYTIRKNILNH